MGIVSLFCFGVVLGPIAWILGNQALAAIDAGQADPGERGNVTAGRVCGIIGTCLNLIGLLIWGLYFLFVAHVMNSFGMRST